MKPSTLIFFVLSLITLTAIYQTLDIKMLTSLRYQKLKNYMQREKMSSNIDPLKTYKEKRNFSKTPEPSADEWLKLDNEKRIFCVQEHHASHLHWDFRLEIEETMPSWAIPKGPSLNPKVKRLAVQTEDHPISYATFEGIIPEGEYGAGTVMVWDYGTYKNIREKNGSLIPMKKCLTDGRIEIFLEGKKLKGTFILIRLKSSKKDWLFFKKNDEYADEKTDITTSANKSALTNRTITQIEKNKAEENKPYKEYS